MADHDAPYDPDRPDDAPASDGDDAAPARRRRVVQYVLLTLTGLVASVVALVVILFLILQTNWGASRALDFFVGLADPTTEAEIEIGEVRGNFITNVSLRDIHVVDTLGRPYAYVDTLNLRYNLLGLFWRTIHFREISFGRIDVSMRQLADGEWDLIRVLPIDTTEVDTTRSLFNLRIDRGAIREGNLTMDFYAPGRDSTLMLRGLKAGMSDIRMAESFFIRFDTLFADVIPPGLRDTTFMSTGGSIYNGLWTVEDTRIVSPRSDLFASGRFRYPFLRGARYDDVDFVVRAEPLHFRDIHWFWPDVPEDGFVRLDGRMTGRENLLDFVLDAALSDGATLAGSGTITPRADEPVRYAAQGELRRFDPGFFTGAPPGEAGRYTADFRFDLAGPSLREVSGPVFVEASDTRIAGYELDRTILEGRFVEGEARLAVNGGLRGARIVGTGTIRPFDDVVPYALQGRFTNLNLDRFDAPVQTHALTGSLEVVGRGFDPETMFLDLTANLGPSRINRAHLSSSRIGILIDEGDMTYDVRLVGAGGVLTASGAADLHEPITYTVARGRMETFDLAALMGEPESSSITASFSLSGQGTEPETMTVRGNVTMAPSRWGDFRIQTASGNFNMDRGLLRLAAAASLDGGHFDFVASIRPFVDGTPYTITRGAFRDVNLAVLLDDPDLQTDLTGTITGSGRGFDAPRMVFDGRIGLTASVINQQPIDAATAVIDLRRGTLTYEARVDFPEGMVAAEGWAAPFQAVPAYTIDQGEFRNLNIGAFAGAPDFQTLLTGTITLSGSGTDPETLDASARIELGPSVINEQQLTSATVAAVVSAGYTTIDASFATAEGGLAHVLAEGRFFDPDPTYVASGTIEAVDVTAFLPGDTLGTRLTAAFEVQGRGFDPQTMQLQGRVSSPEAYYEGLAAEHIEAAFAYDRGLLVVDTLLIRSNVADVTGAGTIAVFDPLQQHYSDFAFTAEVREMEPIRRVFFPDTELLAARDARFTGRIFGRPGTLQFDAVGTVHDVVYDDIRVGHFEGRIAGLFGPERTLDIAEVDATIRTLSLPTLIIDRTELEAYYDGQEIAFVADALIDRTRQAHVQGRVDLRPDAQVITLDDVTLRLDRDVFQLLQPATISYNEVYRVSNFLLFADDQAIAIDGVIDLDGEQSLVMTVENFRLAAVTDLIGYEGLAGRLDASLILLGPADGPTLQGTVNATLVSFDDPVGDLDLSLMYEDLRLSLDAILEDDEGNQLTMAGSIPLDLRLRKATAYQARIAEAEAAEGEVDIRVLSDNFRIAWVRPFLDPEDVSHLDGRLTADIEVTGTMDDPYLDGEAFLRYGIVELPALGVSYTEIEATTRLAGSSVIVQDALMRSGPGTMRASGSIEMPRLTLGEFNLNLLATSFRAVNVPGQYRTDVSGTMRLVGTTHRPVLTGSVRLTSSEFWLPDEFAEIEPVSLTLEDVLMLERNFGMRVAEADTVAFDFFDATAFDLSVIIERDTWLRSRAQPRMDIQFTGIVDVSKEPFGDILVFGAVDVLPERSRVVQFGRRFDIESGSIFFNGPIDEALLDVAAIYEVRSRRTAENEVVINLGLSGRLDDLQLALTSDPQLDMTDIISYIATGRAASEALILGESGRAALFDPAAGLAIGQLAAFVEGVAAEGLGLDVIEIEQDGLRGARITAGKYVTRRLFTSVSYPVNWDQSGQGDAGGDPNERKMQVTVEYEIFRWLLLRAIQRGSLPGLHLLWEYTY
jgi:translocation and assembly module TamB